MTPIHFNVLISKVSCQTPEIKYFVYKLLERFPTWSSINLTAKELAALLKINDHYVLAGLKHLTEQGYLDKESDRREGRGKPRSIYFFTKKMRAAVDQPYLENGYVPIRHQGLISNLLVSDEPAFKQAEKSTALTIRQKIFLAVLLASADEVGVVRSLGLKDLGWLTGMSKECVHGHVKKLLESEYLCTYIPGVTGSRIFKKKSAIYILNLGHQKYRKAAIRAALFLCRPDLPDGFNLRREVYELQQAAIRINKDPKSEPEIVINARSYFLEKRPFMKLKDNGLNCLPCFNDLRRPEVRNYLQGLLDLYASFLLTKHWEILSEALQFPDLIQIIKKDLGLPADSGSSPKMDEGRLQELKSLVEVLQELSVSIARATKLLILNAVKHCQPALQDFDFQNRDYLIYPFAKPPNSLPRNVAIASLSRTSRMDRHVKVLIDLKTTVASEKLEKLPWIHRDNEVGSLREYGFFSTNFGYDRMKNDVLDRLPQFRPRPLPKI